MKEASPVACVHCSHNDPLLPSWGSLRHMCDNVFVDCARIAAVAPPPASAALMDLCEKVRGFRSFTKAEDDKLLKILAAALSAAEERGRQQGRLESDRLWKRAKMHGEPVDTLPRPALKTYEQGKADATERARGIVEEVRDEAAAARPYNYSDAIVRACEEILRRLSVRSLLPEEPRSCETCGSTRAPHSCGEVLS